MVSLTGTGIAPPTIAKSFGATNILLNGTTSLTLVVTNPSTNTLQLNGLAFTDALPAGLGGGESQQPEHPLLRGRNQHRHGDRGFEQRHV